MDAKMAKKAAKAASMIIEPLSIPAITEDDLLAFQSSHFGDDSKPDNWFVDAETALDHQQEMQEEDDDSFGYYEDGNRRTLTDEQITMFRHSEIQELLRERRLQRDEEDYQDRVPEQREDHDQGTHSPMSDASSLEGDLVGLARAPPKQMPRPPPKRQTSRSSRSDTSRSTGPSGAARRKPKKHRQEVPYDERHKRKWEDYIDQNDPVEGSMTHRRIVREMDDLQEEHLDMDY